MLGMVYAARSILEDARGHLQDAVELERTALRLKYTRPDPRVVSDSHHNLSTYLFRTRADPSEQRAHCLAAALLKHLTGDIHGCIRTLRALADELRGDADRPDAPALPTALSDVIRLVDAGDGVHFGDLVAALCPDPDTADQALADLLATAATLLDGIDHDSANGSRSLPPSSMRPPAVIPRPNSPTTSMNAAPPPTGPP